MEGSHDHVVDMEAGLARLDGGLESSTACEKSEKGITPSSTSSTKPILSPRPHRCPLRWMNNSWARFKSSWSRIGQWASRQQRHAIAIRKLDSCPMGYPRLAAFLDSDESFMIYRRFGFLQSRLLLNKQDELRELEEALDQLDKREERKDPNRPMTRDLPEDELKPRKQLVEIIEQKFCSYANLVDAAQKMVALNRPSRGDFKSVQNFMFSHQPLMEAEATCFDHVEDLVTLRAGREHAWLDSGIEKLLQWFHCPLLERVFGDERTRQKSTENEVYYSHEQITRLANCIITFMVIVLLIVPIYLLYHLINDVHTPEAYAICMGILIVSTLAFSAVLSLFTRAKRHEILAAAAAYCAVLVVFLGNIGLKD